MTTGGHRILGMSLRGWRKTGLWTLAGTSGCVAFSMVFNWLVFRDLDSASLARSMIVAAILPVLLAGPLFFYLTMKMRELARLNHMLHDLATRDHVTGLLNRRAMIAEITAMTRKMAALDARTHLFLVIDADRFKQINDRYGHARGDEALVLLADALKSSIRRYDLIGRIGGEEFAVLLPHVTQADATYVADRLRRAVASIDFRPAQDRLDLSVSVGGVVFNEDRPFSELFRAADANLYRAKHEGRNRCVITDIDGADDHDMLRLKADTRRAPDRPARKPAAGTLPETAPAPVPAAAGMSRAG